MRPTPSVIGSRSAIPSITLTSSPLSRATRSRKLSVKSISPRMARSVISRTFSPTPAHSASWSMHSVWMRVESMSKHIRRRQRRYIVSSWSDMSNASSAAMRMKRLCISSRSSGVPRTENSMHAFAEWSSALSVWSVPTFSGGRPVRRCMASMFSPCSAMTSATRAMCRAVSCRPSRVMIQRFFPWRLTHDS